MVAGEGPRALVVIGASAGGIGALSTLLASLPENFVAPIVIAQHLDPTHPSHLPEILNRHTTLSVRAVTEQEPLERGVVYVVPANRHVTITDAVVAVSAQDRHGSHPSIDRLLTSAAQTYGEQLIAVILTGNGADGAAGARTVHTMGGTVIIQNPQTAPFPAMPLSLAPTDVDIIADVEHIGAILHDLTTGARVTTRATEERTLRAFLDQLHARSGIDFTSYKMPTIMRRLQRRMIATGAERVADYIRYVQSHPEEYQRLVSSFLIKVTQFFRDAELFEYLRDYVLPDLVAVARDNNHELRFWSAGCATGEEAYSLAILIADHLGDDLDRFTVRIFATDLDNDAVAFARCGIYPPAALANVPPPLIDRYFDHAGDEYEIKNRVRALTVFGQHDLGQRAPFPRIDLVLCRNVLIYFTTELQKRALHLFAYSLRDGGYLALGKAETTTPLVDSFTVEQSHLKVYRRRGERIVMPPARFRDNTPMLPPSVASLDVTRPPRDAQRARSPHENAEAVLLALPVGLVVVDRRYDIRFINNAARSLFGVHTAAIGEDLIHLAQSLPPAALRAAIDAAFRGEGVPPTDEIAATNLATGDARYLALSCYPQKPEHGADAVDAVLVLVTDITERARERRAAASALDHEREETERLATLVQRLTETNRVLLEANQDLSNSNVELRSANEEFLVATEESQAATEEIETLNEELQATNEELETLNEELQATIEELNTTNDDLHARTIELQDLTVSLEAQRRSEAANALRLATALLSDDAAVLVVNGAGVGLLTNAAYTARFGDPQTPFVAEDESGTPLPPEETPQQRATRGEPFRMVLFHRAADGTRRRYSVTGEPIAGNASGGILVLRETE